jgi:hypothetical protein
VTLADVERFKRRTGADWDRQNASFSKGFEVFWILFVVVVVVTVLF